MDSIRFATNAMQGRLALPRCRRPDVADIYFLARVQLDQTVLRLATPRHRQPPEHCLGSSANRTSKFFKERALVSIHLPLLLTEHEADRKGHKDPQEAREAQEAGPSSQSFSRRLGRARLAGLHHFALHGENPRAASKSGSCREEQGKVLKQQKICCTKPSSRSQR